MNKIRPDYWQLIRIENKSTSEVYYKILSEFRGGYLYGNSWRLSSPVKSVIKYGNSYEIETNSGSVYDCHTRFKTLGMSCSHILYSMKYQGKIDNIKIRVASIKYYHKENK